MLRPDTSELGGRASIHSGPITAGVLRGDRTLNCSGLATPWIRLLVFKLKQNKTPNPLASSFLNPPALGGGAAYDGAMGAVAACGGSRHMLFSPDGHVGIVANFTWSRTVRGGTTSTEAAVWLLVPPVKNLFPSYHPLHQTGSLPWATIMAFMTIKMFIIDYNKIVAF